MASTTCSQDADEAVRLADLDPRHAVPFAERATLRARRERDVTAAAVAERAWGHALLHCGRMDDAIRHLRRSIAFGRRAASAALAAEARMKLSYALVQVGRPDAALREIDAAVDSLAGTVGARARAQRGIVLRLIGRTDEALAELDAALTVLHRDGDLLGVQRLLVNRALVYADRYAFTAAEQDLVTAERLARQLGRGMTVGVITENLGLVAGLRGDVAGALTHFDRAERLLREQGAPLSGIHRDRAELLLSVGLVSEARTSAEQAALAYQEQRRLLMVPQVRLLLAQAALLGREWPIAVDQARRAMREFAGQHRPEWVALARLDLLRAQLAAGMSPRASTRVVRTLVDRLDAAGWLTPALEARLIAARLDLRRGHIESARAHLSAASQAARGRGPAVLRARGWYALALLRLDRGSVAGASAAARRGLRILDEHSAAMGATDLRAHAAIHRGDLVELGLRLALSAGRPANVFEWAERGRASHLLHRPARPPDDPRLAGLLSELRAVARELAAADGAPAPARLVRRQVELERAIRDHSRLRRGEGGDRLLGPVTPSRLGVSLADAALVEFVQLDGVLHAVTLASGRLRLRRSGTVAEVAALTERLPFALHRLAHRSASAGSHAAALALLRSAAARLDDTLLRPLGRELGDRPLVIVPTGVLHSVPWSILPSCLGRPVTVSPSATLWHSAATDARAADSGGVVVAAGPGLHGARSEAAAVAAIHGVTALVDGAATADAVLAALATARVVHLAAHGRLSADNPLFSDLLLADGPLVVYDVERLAGVPHTVVLAACDSGRSVVRTGDELLGLSATFIGKGAAQLVASVLPVPDAETAPLMVAFHRGLAAGQPPAAALATAQQRLARDASDDPPTLAAAAGFVCLGSAG